MLVGRTTSDLLHRQPRRRFGLHGAVAGGCWRGAIGASETAEMDHSLCPEDPVGHNLDKGHTRQLCIV